MVTFIDYSETEYTLHCFFKIYTKKLYSSLFSRSKLSQKKVKYTKVWDQKFVIFFAIGKRKKANENNKKGEITTQGVDVGAF